MRKRCDAPPARAFVLKVRGLSCLQRIPLSSTVFLHFLQSIAIAALLLSSGCATQKFVSLRSMPLNPLATQLHLVSRSGPQVSERTMTLLRHYALQDLYKRDPDTCLIDLQDLTASEKVPRRFMRWPSWRTSWVTRRAKEKILAKRSICFRSVLATLTSISFAPTGRQS